VRAGPGRQVLRATLPIDLLDQLDEEAQRRGIPVDRLVEDLLVNEIPRTLAEAARDRLTTSLRIARAPDAATPPGLPEGATTTTTDPPSVAPSLPRATLESEDAHGASA